MEIDTRHILNNKNFKAIGRRTDCDNVIFSIDNIQYAVVHLVL